MFSFVGLKTVVASAALFGTAAARPAPADACGSRSCDCPCGCGISMPAVMPMEQATPIPADSYSPAPAVEHSQHMTRDPATNQSRGYDRYRRGYQGAVASAAASLPGFSSGTRAAESSHGIVGQIDSYRHFLGKP